MSHGYLDCAASGILGPNHKITRRPLPRKIAYKIYNSRPTRFRLRFFFRGGFGGSPRVDGCSGVGVLNFLGVLDVYVGLADVRWL